MKFRRSRLCPYRAGVLAFREGHFPDDNPYAMGNGNNMDRINWFNGYYDERHDAKFGKMFAEAGLLTMHQERELVR